MSGWTIAWIIWIVAFFAIEVPALVWHRSEGDTLSEHVWKWASIKNKGHAWRLRRFLLAASLAWLSLHFLTGGQF